MIFGYSDTNLGPMTGLFDTKPLKFFFYGSLASLTPFFVFFFFTTPLADDIFYRNYGQDKTTWEFLVHHYTTWTGRYFSNWMMAVNPFSTTSDIGVYPLMMISLFIVYLLSLFLIIRVIVKNLNVVSRNYSTSTIALFLTIIITALFFHKMPRTTDTFYWFAGTSSHLLPMCLILISSALYLRGLNLPGGSMRPLSVILVTLISFIVSGSNETLALQWIFTLAFVIFYQKTINKRWETVLFAPLMFAVAGFIILYFAPGNAVRAKELKGGHDILLLLVKPWGLVAETTVRYISLSLLAALIAVFPKLKDAQKELSEKVKSKNSVWLLNLFGLGLFLLTFVPSVWTMGGLPPRRVLNNTYLVFLLYGTFLIILSAHKIKFLERWSDRFSGKNLNVIFAVSLIAFFNNFYAWKDLANLPKYTESMSNRDVIVSSGQGKDLILPPLTYFPTTFFYEDITVKTDDYRNIVFAEFYKLKSVALSKDYDNVD